MLPIQKIKNIKLQHVRLMPKDLEEGFLYVSKEFEIAVHLCACGCKSKIRTPLDSLEWSLTETADGPTLHPSIGSWQLPCRSHYLINKGKIIWCGQWSDEQILAGRQAEQRRRDDYYVAMYKKQSIISRVISWLKKLFS